MVGDCTGVADSPGADVARRLVDVLAKREIPMIGSQSSVVGDGGLQRFASEVHAASCIVLIGDSDGHPGACLDAWRWLDANAPDPTLIVACQLGVPDPALTDAMLNTNPAFAPIALAQQTPVTPRAAALFLMKFLTELHLHTDQGNSISGRMAWFSHRKAAELLKRRRLDATFGLRA